MEFERRMPSVMGPDYFTDPVHGTGSSGSKTPRRDSNVGHGSSHLEVAVTTNISEMSEHQLQDTIRSIYDRECEIYGRENNGALAKGYFISGDLLAGIMDLSRIKLPDNSPLISEKNEAGRKKKISRSVPEFIEAIALLNFYGERKRSGYYEINPRERELDKLDILSEVSDLTFNLLCMSFDDKEYADEYKKWIGLMSSGLGYSSNRELYMMAAAKYNSRIMRGVGKNFVEERETLRELIVPQGGRRKKHERGPAVIMPSDDQLDALFDPVHDIGMIWVPNRIRQMPVDRRYPSAVK